MLKWLHDNRNQLLLNILAPIIGSIIVAAYTKYILEQNILDYLISESVTIPSAIITTAGIFILILYLFVVTLWVNKKSSKSSLEINKNLKRIQFPAKLGTQEFEKVIFTFEINFEFNPEIQYNSSDFADRIYISEHYICADPNCKSVLIESHSYTLTSIVCPNDPKHFNMDKGDEFFVLSNRVEGFFKGMVMQDYEKYWDIYKKELRRATNNKLQDFYHHWD